MRTVGNRISVSVVLISFLLVSGCGFSSTMTSSQEVFFSDYGMTINKNFISLNPSTIADRRFHGSIVAAYSMPTSLENIFEKNIIIIQDDLGTFDFQMYVNQSLGGIKNTWGGYKQLLFMSDQLSCNGRILPAIQHNFSVVRGGITGTGQIIYFMQYFFAKEKKIFILSSSTDNKDDLEVLDTYKDSIRCITGTVIDNP